MRHPCSRAARGSPIGAYQFAQLHWQAVANTANRDTSYGTFDDVMYHAMSLHWDCRSSVASQMFSRGDADLLRDRPFSTEPCRGVSLHVAGHSQFCDDCFDRSDGLIVRCMSCTKLFCAHRIFRTCYSQVAEWTCMTCAYNNLMSPAS